MTETLAKKSVRDRRLRRPAATAPFLHELGPAEAHGLLIAPAAGGAAPHEIERLYASLDAVTPQLHPRTARLLAASGRKVAQKVIEEAGEVALAAVKHNRRNIVRESADLLYQLAVLWHRQAIPPEEIWAEMHRRAETLGIAEKLPKTRASVAVPKSASFLRRTRSADF